jgi:hypothetical protein
MAHHENERLTADEILAQIPAARARGVAERAQGRRATEASYDGLRRTLALTLSNGVAVVIPVAMIDALKGATAPALRAVQVSPSGAALRFDALDVDLGVPALLALAFKGTQAAQALTVLAGSTKSEKKAAAARENGKKGGRPRTEYVFGVTPARVAAERRSGEERRQPRPATDRAAASGKRLVVRAAKKTTPTSAAKKSVRPRA